MIEKVKIIIRRGLEDELNVPSLVRAYGLEVVEEGEADAVIIVGNDRDILHTVQQLGEISTPILGISPTGSESFLASVTIDELGHALESLKNGSFEVASYTRLRGTVNGKQELYAINEIAIFPARSATLMSYDLYVDGERIWSDRADGLLVATPLGSTAYALSAGGVAILERAPVLEIVPVNSLDTSKRPLVVPDDSTIELKGITSRNHCEAVADGCLRLKVGDKVLISKADSPVNLIRLYSRPSVKEVLKEKLARDIADMPPSAKFILKMLELNGPMTVRELVESTFLPERTVRHALSELLHRKLVSRSVNLRDARQIYYAIAQR